MRRIVWDEQNILLSYKLACAGLFHANQPGQFSFLREIMEINHEYFLDEFNKFREIMCSTEYSINQKQAAHHGLLRVYMNVKRDNPENEKLRQQAMEMLQAEAMLPETSTNNHP
jgi:hypothetical protein